MGQSFSTPSKEEIQQSLFTKERKATHQLTRELDDAEERFYTEYSSVPPFDNSSFPPSFSPLPLPLDSDGYCVSFTVDEVDQFMSFYDKYGLVVIRDVLTEEECGESERECWDFMERHSEGELKREDPSTWDNNNWPALSCLGILGNEVVLSPQFFANRQNPKIYKAFTHLLGSEDLISNIGRASCMRPTRNVKMTVRAARLLKLLPSKTHDNSDNTLDNDMGKGKEKGQQEEEDKLDNDDDDKIANDDENGEIEVDVPRWKTLENWLHLDFCPWTGVATAFAWHSVDWKAQRGYSPYRTQSILSLVDCAPNDGGFHCVPGFHHHIRGWANANVSHYRVGTHIGSVNIPQEDEMRKHICKVPLRKGSLLVWMSTIPHGTFPNDSCHGRMIQYIGFARSDDESVSPLFRSKDVFPDGWVPSELGKRLFGIPL